MFPNDPIVINGKLTSGKSYIIPQRILNNQLVILEGFFKYKDSAEFFIQVTNYTKGPIWLAQNQMLTKVQPYQQIQSVTHLTKEDIVKQIEELPLEEEILPEQNQQLRDLLKEYIDIFATNLRKPPTTFKVKHQIDTGTAEPLKQRGRCFSPKEKETIAKEVSEMEQNQIIQKSNSPWKSPIVLVPKPDGSIRFCVDYRKLNKITRKDVYPLPRINETLEKMKGMKFFSAIDLACGYWQIEMDKASKEKSAFTCEAGLYEFNVMPFGLTNAPATFQRMMDEIITEAQVGQNYLDDVILGTVTFEEHLHDLRKLLDTLRKNHLTLKLSKC